MEKTLETIEDKKNKIVEKLSSKYSLNHISLEEYERLIEYSHKIETDKELIILERIADGYNFVDKNDDKKIIFDDIAKDHVTILASRKTSGPIVSGSIKNILGTHKMLINEEDLIEDETVLNFNVILGEVVIYVSDNVDVICRIIPILSDIKIKDKHRNKGGRKRIILEGRVILGDIKIKTRPAWGCDE